MKDIVLLWIQWCGKWTQWELLLNKFKNQINYFEAGGILRALQSKPNDIWSYIGNIIDNGGLLPDEFMVKVFDLFLSTLQKEKPILIDGFPRQIPQMHSFLKMMKEYKREFTVIVLDITREEAINRILSRRMCKDCWAILNTKHNSCDICNSKNIYQRIDEKDISSIEKRIDLFELQTKPVLDYLQKQGFVRIINGLQTEDKIFEDILNVI